MLLDCKCFGGGGTGGDDLLWHVDLKRHASGDYSFAMVQANSKLEDQGQVFTSPSATYLGVYDGHGGPQASRFVSRRLFPLIHEFAAEHGGLSAEVIKKAFSATEEEFLQTVKRSWMSQPEIASAGSCCLLGIVSEDLLYVANLGDSRAVMGRRVSGEKGNGTVVAERLTTDHNVGVEEVRKEVEALHPDDAKIVIHARGVWRIKGIIQVSRSIGDVYLKKPEMSRDPLFQQFGTPVPLKRAVMTAEPSVTVRKLNPEDMFLILATDGLWEQLSDEAAVDVVLKNPRAGIARRLVKAALQEAAKKREMIYDDITKIEKGVRRYFHDDITVIVMFLDHPSGRLRAKPSLVDCVSSPANIYSSSNGSNNKEQS